MPIASTTSNPAKPRGLALALGWRRVLSVLIIATVLGLLLSLPSASPARVVIVRTWIVGLAALSAFGLIEQWPERLPDWMGRWVLQLIVVVVAVPFGALLAYWLTTGELHFMRDKLRVAGFVGLVFTGVLVGPWIALGAMVRQREAFARSQALTFKLEKSELERQALDARMRLLQAQVQPHFLFNTLANVQALVDAGSPQASKVLRTLIAYLRAAVPRLHEPITTLGEEMQLVRAYLELMHMRMPDRLHYVLQVDDAALELLCPPLTLMTLVENAVRHGIDPSEDGGYIEISVLLRKDRCQVRVCDSGVGLQQTSNGLGTGLSTLRERLQMTFDGDAQLHMSALEPHGMSVELDFPAQRNPK